MRMREMLEDNLYLIARVVLQLKGIVHPLCAQRHRPHASHDVPHGLYIYPSYSDLFTAQHCALCFRVR